MCRHAAILLVAVVAALAKGKFISISDSRLISVPKEYLEFLNDNELEENRESNSIGEAVEVKIPPMPAPNSIPDIKGYLKVFEAAVKKLEQKPNALPGTNNAAEQEMPKNNKPERLQFRRKEITTETEIVAEFPETRLQNMLHHSSYNPSADQENPGTDQESPSDDQESPGTDQESPSDDQVNSSDDQENPGTDQENPGSGKVNTGNRTESCPNSFVPINGRCYHFSSRQLNDWNKSTVKCRTMDAALLIIESKKEWDGVKDYLTKRGLEAKNWWIGASDEPDDRWKWVGSSAIFDFTDWCSGEPNNSRNREHCAHIAGVGNHDSRLCWNDNQCIVSPGREAIRYICKI